MAAIPNTSRVRLPRDACPALKAIPVPGPSDRRLAIERIAILAAGIAVTAAVHFLDLGPSKLWYARHWLGGLFPYVAWPAGIMAGVVVLSMAWRLVLWLLYRPAPPLHATDPRLPAVTVVVPAYNEGPEVEACIRSILHSDYPRDLLRVVVVDDGSVDDTWRYMRRGAAADPARVILVRRPRNGGRRKALYDGFARATTHVVVTVDSDTEIPRKSLRALVTPIVTDPGVGAVAGRIEVLNRRDNILTRMIGVRFRIGFDFVRAYQSKLKSVFVCPGAFTAYRMDVIRDGLPAWRDHRFLGRPCHNGDDHHLTNMVLRRGWATVYQSNAEARTKVPATYMGLCKMYLRWARSNIRESLVYLGFSPRLLRRVRNVPAVVDAMARFVQIPLRLYLLALGWLVIFMHPSLFLRSIGLAVMFSFLYAAIYLRSERSLDLAYTVAYAVFSLLTLQWIYPAAAATIRRNGWLTR